jgi:ATP-dependent Lon protease
MATALVSAITRIPVHRRVAMTGEITLRGRVLPIGGVKEKVIAAHRAGAKAVILPRDNERDLRDVPEFVRKDLRFVFAEDVDEVLREALAKPLPALRPASRVSPAGTTRATAGAK